MTGYFLLKGVYQHHMLYFFLYSSFNFINLTI
nr:MAG TPA: hypothetical protein [Caudoviricetes sp.]